VEAPLDNFVHVDVSVAGCTPKPEAIMEGLYKAALILKEKREAMHK
jgi:membrane-bound hydrogenase subunit mbhJ